MQKVAFFLIILFYYASGITENNSASPRLVDGNEAVHNQFPYAVSIQLITPVGQVAPATRNHICGGSLITLQHVLTAASCLYTPLADGTIIPINASEYRVFAGGILLSNDTLPSTVRLIANYTIHPEFIRSPAFLNDIAIVTLTEPFLASEVTPVALPSEEEEEKHSGSCTVAGWGATAPAVNPAPSTTLKYATKYIYNQQICMVVYAILQNEPNVFDTMLCAASFNGVTSGCQGDAGNTLVCNGTATGILFRYTCDTSSTYPELYTRVSNYTTWIRSITGSGYSISPAITMLIFAVLFQFITSKIVK